MVEVREARGPEPRQLLVHFVGDDDADHADEWIGVGVGRLRRLPIEYRACPGERVLGRDSFGNWAEAKVVEVREDGQLEEEQHAQAEAALYGLEGTF